MHSALETPRSVGHQAALRRRPGLPLLVLYGVGITVGAGIYVLIGTVAGHAGVYSPWSFMLAGIVMAFTVASYIELSTRFPVSAGEAAYVRAAFGSRALSTLVGLSTIVIGVMSASAVTLGAVGYIQQFIDLPQAALVLALLFALGAVAAWGILESVVIAGLLTLVEVGGLIIIIIAGIHADLPIAATLASLPPVEFHVLSGIATASLLTFFAFIGFEDLANIVEEAQEPRRDIPRAMILTRVISTVLYVVVAAIAVSAVSIDRLASSSAPLSLVFREVAGASPQTISAIAIVATLNTILAQITMAARVIYGMARWRPAPPGRYGAPANWNAMVGNSTCHCGRGRIGIGVSVRGFGRKHIRRDARRIRPGKRLAVAPQISLSEVNRNACACPDLDAGRRTCVVSLLMIVVGLIG